MKVYTIEEAAALLKVSPRSLADKRPRPAVCALPKNAGLPMRPHTYGPNRCPAPVPHGQKNSDVSFPSVRERGTLIQQIAIQVNLDPYMPLKALSAYSGLSVRTLRKALADPARPLPHYHLGGKILVRRSEFDRWMAQFRQERADLDQIVSEIAKEVA